MIAEQNHIIILKPIIRNDPSLVYWSVQAAEIHFHPRSGTPRISPHSPIIIMHISLTYNLPSALLQRLSV